MRIVVAPTLLTLFSSQTNSFLLDDIFPICGMIIHGALFVSYFGIRLACLGSKMGRPPGNFFRQAGQVR